MIKIAPEGWPFIIGSAILTLIIFMFTKNWYTVIPAVLVLFMIFFFRDPERVIPHEEGIFVAPADGKVIVIKETTESVYLKRKAQQISIFMSPFDVHVNRSPVRGKVVDVIRTKGGFRAAFKDDAALSNENTVMLLESDYGTIMVRQVAGFIARRIVCKVESGAELERGQRYGIIKFSSRVDIFLPENVKITVALNDSVQAGKTIIARARK